jgi:hypothetical protein
MARATAAAGTGSAPAKVRATQKNVHAAVTRRLAVGNA